MSINKISSLISAAEQKRLEEAFTQKFVIPVEAKSSRFVDGRWVSLGEKGNSYKERLDAVTEYVAFLKNKIEQLEDEHNEAIEEYEGKIALLEEGNDLSQNAYYRDLQDEIATLKHLLNEGGAK